MQHAPLKSPNTEIPATWIFLGLFALVVFGTGILFLISSFNELTPAQETLLATGDWMVKGSVGAILGFAGGAGLASKNSGG